MKSAIAGDPPPLHRDASVIGIVAVAHATSHFFHLILAPLFPWLKAAFDLNYSELGMLMTVFFLVSGIGQAIAGFVVDRIGAYPVHLVGVSLLLVSAVGLSLSQSYASLLFFEAVAGLGNSVFHPSGFTILNKRVTVSRLPHAFSVHGVSGTLGWAAAPLFLAGLATLTTWRIALMAAAGLAGAVLVVLALNRRILETHKPPEGAPHLATPHPARGSQAAFAGIMHLLGLPALWMCFAFFLITAMSSGGIQSFAPEALREIYHVPITLASACITAYMLANACGMIWGGFLAAHTVHHERVIAISFAAAGILAIIVASGFVPSSLTIIFLALIGLGAGIAGPSRDLLVRAAAPEHATGSVYGLVYSGLDVGLSVSPLLFGRFMDLRQPQAVFFLIGVFQAAALFTAIGIRKHQSSQEKHNPA